MSKARNFAELAPNIGFSEFDFYDLYRSAFEKSELGRVKKLLPLHAMAENFGLVSKSMRPKLGRKSYFTSEGEVALMFLKMYRQQMNHFQSKDCRGSIPNRIEHRAQLATF